MKSSSAQPAKPLATSPWLINEKWDTMLMTMGSTLLVMAMIAVLWYRGDKELDWIDLILSEFHLGATYDAIFRRRLWKTMPWQIVFIPLLIIGSTYALVYFEPEMIILTSIIVYTAVWHRGRQNYGVAAYYQRQVGGPISSLHRTLYLGAVYLPMIAAILYYTSYTTLTHEKYRYWSLPTPPWLAWGLGLLAMVWFLVYFAYSWWHLMDDESQRQGRAAVHPAELWIMLSHLLAFASAYVFGAWSAGFILVLAIHHEVQYLYFAYAIARKRTDNPPREPGGEVKFFLAFLIWPILGFTTAMAHYHAEIMWLFPLWTGMLLCHYWWDGQIWTRKAFSRSLDKAPVPGG